MSQKNKAPIFLHPTVKIRKEFQVELKNLYKNYCIADLINFILHSTMINILLPNGMKIRISNWSFNHISSHKMRIQM